MHRTAAASPEEPWFTAWLRRRSFMVFVALTTIASLRIAATYTTFSHTYDEPAHIATGMEWLDRGSYRYEPLHPPLARVAIALGPYLDGGSSHGEPDKWNEGLDILCAHGAYQRTLVLARLGVLPFFWIACTVVYLWGRKYAGEPVASLAVLLFTLLPPVLAHAGLATTDLALTAMTGAAFLSALHWCERPRTSRSLGLGLCTGLAVLSKFSALAFLPVALGAALLWHLLAQRRKPAALLIDARQRLPGLLLAGVTAFLTIWAGYRFSFGAVSPGSWPLPFPELYAGLRQLLEHQVFGAQFAYLMGERNNTGWWWYYFVVLGVKTPLAFLLLLACGTLATLRGGGRGLRLALAFSCGILLFCLASRINLGVRHVLPVYLGFSLVAAGGLAALLRHHWRPAGWIGAALLLWMGTASALSHPDYLAYFNEAAGAHPERIVVDSDLDWGQDLGRLSRRLRELGVKQIAFEPCMLVRPADLGLPLLTRSDFLHPSPGWNAVRLTPLQLMVADEQLRQPRLRFWPEVIPPTERIGRGILLWYFPPENLPAAPAWLPPAHAYCG